MPERRHRKFNAPVPPTGCRARPAIRATFAAATRLPSAPALELSPDRASERERAASMPGDGPGLPGGDRAANRASAGIIASVVMSPARPRSSTSAARTSGSTRMRIIFPVTEHLPKCGFFDGAGRRVRSPGRRGSPGNSKRRARARRFEFPGEPRRPGDLTRRPAPSKNPHFGKCSVTGKMMRILVEPIVRAALIEDLGRAGDITTDAGSADGAVRRRHRRAPTRHGRRHRGRALAFRLLDPTMRCRRRTDGAPVASGRCRGADRRSAHGLLSAERVALNFACRLSGIATATARLVDAIAGRTGRASSARARPRRACAFWRSTRCAPAAASITASASTMRC